MRSSARFCSALVLAFGLLAALPVAAQEEIQLDLERRAALAALPHLHGRAVSAESLADKAVVVTFFASWCPPCTPEFHHLKELDARYRDRGVKIVAVNIFEDFFGDDGGKRLKGFLIKMDPDFTVVGDGEQVAEAFGAVARIPTVLVFDRDGQPALHFIHQEGATKTHVGLEELVAAVNDAL